MLLVLGILILATILIVGLLQFSSVDRAASQVSFQGERARLFADMGLDYAVSQIRDATTAGSQAGKFWASQPGRITVFNSVGTVDTASSRTLISYDPNAGTSTNTGTVDLNQATFSGTHPIASPYGVTAPAMPAAWVNVQQDPLAAASAQNPVVGRYAFWVDDETTKMNINTADGTAKAAASSFGAGTPPEVSLQSLTESGTAISATQAAAISTQTGALPATGVTGRFFSSVRDILGVPGVSSTILPENLSDITTYNRAPELNQFGEPRIYLASIGLNNPANTILENGAVGAQITQAASGVTPPGLPLTEVYPSSGYYNAISKVSAGNQLPGFTSGIGTPPSGLVPPVFSPKFYPLPQYFAYAPYIGDSLTQTFPRGASASFPNFYADDYMMGMRIAQYLENMNSQGVAVQWPVYPGADTKGFSGKYTKRQIDSITLQLLGLMKEGVYSDNAFTYSLPPVMAKGFLSGLPVAGVGRVPRVTQVQVQVTTGSSTMQNKTQVGTPNITVPYLTFTVNVQWFFPDGFVGASLNHLSFGWQHGNYSQISPNPNTQFMCLLDYPDAPTVNIIAPSLTIRRPNSGGATVFTPSKTVSGVLVPGSGPSCLGDYWMDQQLVITDEQHKPAGVDLFGNDPTVADPDQTKAALYHPYTYTGTPGTTSGIYNGSGPGLSVSGNLLGACPALEMAAGGFNSAAANWPAGQYRTMCNRFQTATYPTKPGVTQINISGGISVWTTGPSGSTWFQADPTPLDSLRGPIYTGEDITINGAARDAVLAAVIPISMQLSIPGTQTVTMAVADPAVNKFAGDWQSVTPGNVQAPSSATTSPNIYTASSVSGGVPPGYMGSAGGDPAAIWWPPQLVTIPKIQRFPSAGYLQYLHTGIMPDPSQRSERYSLRFGQYGARHSVPAVELRALDRREPADGRRHELSRLGDARSLHRACLAAGEPHAASARELSYLRRRDHGAHQSELDELLFPHASAHDADARFNARLEDGELV